MIQFQKMPRQTEKQIEGQKDGQTLFHRTLPANAGGPKIIFYITIFNLKYDNFQCFEKNKKS